MLINVYRLSLDYNFVIATICREYLGKQLEKDTKSMGPESSSGVKTKGWRTNMNHCLKENSETSIICCFDSFFLVYNL